MGLTLFKKVSEYLICLILLAAGGLLLRNREKFEPKVLRLLLISIALTIGSELAFTFYISVYGVSNLIGHLFKIASFYLIYHAIIATSLVRPYDLLFRNLRQSENKFRSLYTAMNEGVCLHEIVYDKDGTAMDYRITDVNPAYESILGIKREDAHQRKASKLYGSDAPPFLDRYAEVAATGRSITFDSYLPEMEKHFRISAFSPGKGAFATVFADITERKRAEEKLQQENREVELSNRILRVFLEESGEQVFATVLDIVLEGMQSEYGVFGYIAEPGHLVCPSLTRMLDQCEIEGKCIHYPPEKWKGLWARALEEKRTFYVNEPPKVPAGHPVIRNNLATPILFQGEAIGLLNLANKQTGYSDSDLDLLEALAAKIAPVLYVWIQKEIRNQERRQAEEALRKSNLKLELLSATARQLLTSDQPEQIVQTICERVMAHLDCHVFFNYLIDEEEQRLHLNAYAGIPAEAAGEIEWLDYGEAGCGCVGRDGNRIVAEDIRNAPEERTALVRSFGIQAYACHPLLYQDRVIGTLSFGAGDRPGFTERELYLMKTVTDQVATAVARKQTEEQIKALNDKLKMNVDELAAANKELEAFSYSVSHDLRAPLRSIAGFSQALLEDYDETLDAEGREFLVRIIAAVKKMGRLIDDLLDLSRVTRVKMKCEAVDLSGMTMEIAERLRKAQPERQVEIVIAEGLTAIGDGRLLQVVLDNLIGNAWKFTAKRAEAKIEFGTRRLDGRDVYYIEDNGDGFDKTYAAKLFTPFQRLHHQRDFAGTGIGLATVMRIIRRHGGEVWIEGEAGKGATAYFTTKSSSP